jgi:TonB family protein
MSTAQIWNNIVAYALQIGLLVGLGALVPSVLRLRTPRAKLLYWQALLIACVVLPSVQPWRQEVISLSSVNTSIAVEPAVTGPVALVAVAPAYASARRAIPFTSIVLWLLAAGVIIRLVWLAIGLARLAGYRRRGHDLASDPVFKIATAANARWLVSEEIPSPVTFGWRDPVVLLPARFPSLRTELREAILCHELIHVERRDWMFTLAEEIVRAVLWFHPAIWWVLGEIQLSREQTVDQAVIEITRERGLYVDALLAMAGAFSEDSAAQLDLAPAPLFLRKRHLKQRVFELLQEVRMSPFSRVRLIVTHLGAAAAIVGACWVVSSAFPLSAAPQVVADAPGVSVDTGDAKLLSRIPVEYPREALENGVEGKVVIQASVGADGSVSDDTVVRCPRELCDAAVDSLPDWRFDTHQANTTRSISIDFKVAQAVLPAFPAAMLAQAPQSHTVTFNSRTTMLNGFYVIAVPPTYPNAIGQPLSDVRITGLSDSSSSQLKSRLPVQAGDVWSAASASIVSQVVRDFDPNLEVDMVNSPNARHEWVLWIGPPAPQPGGQPSVVMPSLPPGVYEAGDGIRPPAVLTKVDPAYPSGSLSAGITGWVALSVVVGADGTPQNIQVLHSLEPDLDQAAVDAVARWRFRPGTTPDGVPVSIQAQVNLSFRLL